MSKIRKKNVLLLAALLFLAYHAQNANYECKKLKKMTKEDVKKSTQEKEQKRIQKLAQKENYYKVMMFIHKYDYFNFANEEQKANLLEIAVYNNNYRDVKALLACEISANITIDNASTIYIGINTPKPIISKATGKPKILELLLQNGANPNARCGIGATPLIQAVKQNCIESVKLLLQYGANTKMREFMSKTNPEGKGKTALDYAIENGNKEIACLIRKKEATCRKRKKVTPVTKKKTGCRCRKFKKI